MFRSFKRKMAVFSLCTSGVILLAFAVGVAVNTSRLTPADAATACAQIEDLLGLPCQDPVTMGVGRIADRLQACFAN